jgi:hypothetical protein
LVRRVESRREEQLRPDHDRSTPKARNRSRPAPGALEDDGRGNGFAECTRIDDRHRARPQSLVRITNRSALSNHPTSHIPAEPGQEDHRFNIHTAERAYRSQIFIDEDSGLMRYKVFLDVPFLEFDEGRVIEIIGRLSNELVWGSFEYNFDLRFPYFRNAARIDKSGNPRGAIKQLLESGAYPLELWEKVIPHLTDYSLSARDCIHVALLRTETVEPRDLSRRVVKALPRRL